MNEKVKQVFVQVTHSNSRLIWKDTMIIIIGCVFLVLHCPIFLFLINIKAKSFKQFVMNALKYGWYMKINQKGGGWKKVGLG